MNDHPGDGLKRGSYVQCAALVFLLIVPLSALAGSDVLDYNYIGAGVRTRPAYDGSASQRAELIPAVRYYGGPWFARTTQGILEGGARMEISHGLNIGAQVAYEGGRLAKESDFLRDNAVPDIGASASAGVHIEWDQQLGPVPINLLARWRQFMDSDRGAQADLRFTVGVFSRGGVIAGVYVQETWANSKSNQSFYGITPEQSTKLLPYTAGSGPLYVAGGLLWGIDVGKSWIVIGNLEVQHLQGDASRSPLVERTSNYYASASLAYKF